MTVAAVLVAAGSGSRLGHPLPKAFVPVGGVPLVVHAARALLAAGVARLVVTVPADQCDVARDLLASVAPEAVVVAGGPTRQASVAAGLAALRAPTALRAADDEVGVLGDVDVILVHDAARAFAPVELVRRVVDAVRAGHPAVVPALPVPDTVKRVGAGAAGSGGEPVVETLPRGLLRAVQTPQGFVPDVLAAAHTAAAGRAQHEATAASDDAGLVEAIGVPVWVVPGDERAAKITTARDLAAVELRRAEGGAPVARATAVPRTGIGVDVHAYDPDPPAGAVLHLAGLTWPGERPLAGHSDADVAAHAAADALLAAAGLGDLGSQIGTSDPQWRGAAGTTILAEMARRVRAAGFVVGNVAVQVIGNAPRLGPRRAAAAAALTAAAGAPVSVSATTTDGLGLTGRGEGIAALATAIVLPVGDPTDAS